MFLINRYFFNINFVRIKCGPKRYYFNSFKHKIPQLYRSDTSSFSGPYGFHIKAVRLYLYFFPLILAAH